MGLLSCSTQYLLYQWEASFMERNTCAWKPGRSCYLQRMYVRTSVCYQPEHSKVKIRSKMSLLDTIPLPELYQWMCKMMVVLLSKVGTFHCRQNSSSSSTHIQFSFYFESVLSQQATATDMKAIGSRLQIDFVSLYVCMCRDLTCGII